MKRAPFISILFYLFFLSASSVAEEQVCYRLESDDMVTGTIRSMGRNSIDIDDEYSRTVKRFVDLDHPSPFHPGDRVRVYYDRGTNLVRSIKKMTMLDYAKNGQNLGYIIKH